MSVYPWAGCTGQASQAGGRIAEKNKTISVNNRRCHPVMAKGLRGRCTCFQPETGFADISLQLNDHTDCGIGGRQYGTSEDIETLQG